MADDTRQDTSSTDYKPFKGDQWNDASTTKRSAGPANIMPGGTANTAGGERPDDVDVVKAAKLISWDDWATLPTKPCVKDSLMTGIGSGFALGGVRAVMRAPVFTACNWAVGGFCFTSFAMYQYCTQQRKAEREGMKQAMEIIDRKSIERKQKEQRMERARELRRQKKEEEDQEAFAKLRVEKEQSPQAQQKSWWKVW
ncbi:hypothetical protein K461DRAFT_292047 [Myriangium duriaei CBS 260.36]|uniref:Cytochrome c oxidase assembly protein COX20, mitochondrial n=1 Tax=Myriangium duriaei CBS 260.36 TaxID=1168546 RepID=A0A9P4JA98_9PEZI|nr:hypothetical protein K461DRAFT_292047 [Myriangium duriaei CBS 260.36]